MYSMCSIIYIIVSYVAITYITLNLINFVAFVFFLFSVSIALVIIIHSLLDSVLRVAIVLEGPILRVSSPLPQDLSLPLDKMLLCLASKELFSR